ncbi:hypothetical protein RJT34_12940 [Clitoria ternatea]|uniref:Uncharacterized protein n=1 Tax=Clitoria ternatea TaxID=43366 RepID=A0AAN9PKZ9_CLITE
MLTLYIIFSTREKAIFRRGKVSRGLQSIAKDIPNTLMIIAFDGNISTGKPTEEPLPYDRDVELRLRCYRGYHKDVSDTPGPTSAGTRGISSV